MRACAGINYKRAEAEVKNKLETGEQAAPAAGSRFDVIVQLFAMMGQPREAATRLLQAALRVDNLAYCNLTRRLATRLVGSNGGGGSQSRRHHHEPLLIN